MVGPLQAGEPHPGAPGATDQGGGPVVSLSQIGAGAGHAGHGHLPAVKGADRGRGEEEASKQGGQADRFRQSEPHRPSSHGKSMGGLGEALRQGRGNEMQKLTWKNGKKSFPFASNP